jgi:hypothetical protein
MSHPQRLLEGEVAPENGDQSELQRLRDVNRTLTRELHDVLDENEQLKQRVAVADAPIARLREKLTPFYRMLQAIFGDIEDLGPAAPDSPSNETPGASDPRAAAAWEEWKQRMPGAPAKIITALQKHGKADTTQLCILIGTNRRQTVHDAIHKLNKSGLLDKNGGQFSLKKL